jgi:glycosyltransferase involved in cell wall biosynthesis
MRLLLLSDFFPPVRGGLEAHVDTLAAALVERGHEVHVATLTKNPEPTHPGVTTHVVETATSRVVRHVDSDRPFHPPTPDVLARRGLARVINGVRPDVIHAHSWLGASLPARRPPLVFTAHDYSLVCQLRTLMRPDGQLCEGGSVVTCTRCGAATYGRGRSAALAAGTAAGRRLFRPDVMLAVSDHVRRMIEPGLGRPVHVLNGFIPHAFGDLPTAGLNLPDAPFVMYAGDPGAHKGVDLLLDIWAQPEPPRAPLLLALTKPLGRAVPPNVVVREYDRAQVLAAWRRARLAVVPSRWHEPFPTVAMEALAAGVPVIASRVGGLVDIVRDGVDGVLIPHGDRPALRNAIVRLLDDDALAVGMATAAVSGARRFDARTVIPRLETIYRQARTGERGAA